MEPCRAQTVAEETIPSCAANGAGLPADGGLAALRHADEGLDHGLHARAGDRCLVGGVLRRRPTSHRRLRPRGRMARPPVGHAPVAAAGNVPRDHGAGRRPMAILAAHAA